jgi:hypothetical protein
MHTDAERRLVLSSPVFAAAVFLIVRDGGVNNYDGRTMYEVTAAIVDRGAVAISGSGTLFPGGDGVSSASCSTSVLQGDGEPARVGEIPEARVVEELIRGSEREAGSVRVPVHGIPLDQSVVVSTTSHCDFDAVDVPRARVTLRRG